MEALLVKQERLSGYIVRSLENLKRTGRANITLGVVEARIANIDSQWATFVEQHELLEEMATAEHRKLGYFTNDVYTLTEDGYCSNKGQFLDIVRQFKAEDAAPARAPSGGTQLPKINLPKFSGYFAEWPSFRDLFASMVSDNTALTAVEKFHYLKMSLTKEPAALLASVPLTAENLESSWKTLTDRYENIRLLTAAQISTIFALQPMKAESSSELRTLYNGTANAVSALRALGRPVDGYGDLLVYMTVLKLDKQSRREWEASMGSKKAPPTFEELQAFLEARICAIQALEPPGSTATSAAKSSGASSTQPKADSKPITKVKSYQVSKATAGAKKCALCRQDHFVVFCDEFRAKSIDERRAFVLSNNLCLNCLGRDFVRECRSQKVCQVCKERHHTMIHGSGANTLGPPMTSDARPQGGDGQLPTTSHQASAVTFAGHVAYQTPCRAPGSTTRVLLATALVRTFTAGGACIPVRALLDQGSEVSGVTESLAQRLRLPRSSSSTAISGIGAQSVISPRGSITLRITPHFQSDFSIDVDALVLPRLAAYSLPRVTSSGAWPHLDGLLFADPDFTSGARIDLLLGADIYARLLSPGLREAPLNAPAAQNTKLGWILSGRVALNGDAESVSTSLHISVDQSLSAALQRFWEQEEITASPLLTPEEQECEEHFVSTHSRDPDGRYLVRLPLKTPVESLGDSRSAAARMLTRMEQRFARDRAFADAYSAFLTEYEELGHMELATSTAMEPARHYYLPHHGVVRESSETTKLRVVFNGSQKTSLGVSLNDCLHVGPPLLPELVNVLLRWRRHAVVFSADMEKMFRQILVHPDDRDLQRILWRKHSGSPPDAYRLRTVTYGLACAPYLALRVIRQLAFDERESFPRGSEALLTDVYVDDVLWGADDVASALSKQREIIGLLKAGGFALRKWTSNAADLLAHLSPSDRASGTVLDIPAETAFHMLGLSWRADSDCFVFRLKTPRCELPLTKRKILSRTAELFDPLGWLAPVIVKAKVFLQSLWLLKVGWDDPLPDAESQEWLTFYEHLPHISHVQISRWLKLQSTSQDITLHGFADASERAYAAVVYLCTSNASRTSTLVAAKTKVSPLKQVSLPRLELCAAHLLVRLVKSIIGVLSLDCPVHLWSDSTVTLAWIQGHPVRWKTYVANRVSEIQRTLPDALWHHVESQQNPADCASRGLLASELRCHALWWTGPPWLLAPQDSWPSTRPPVSTDPPEQRATSHTASKAVDDPWDLLVRYSSLIRLQRIAAWCQRFIDNARRHGEQKNAERRLGQTLLPSELAAVLDCLIRVEQARLFQDEVSALESRAALKKGPLLRLNPFLGDGRLLRVGGRLRHAILDADERHPVIIPRDSPLALLLVDRAHHQTLHGGTQLTLATLRQRFWIISGRSLVKTFIGRCIRCLRFRAATATQLMGDLPKERVNRSRPFHYTGVDYAGPIYLRTTKGRGHKSTKGYIAVFVCFATKAVHLDAVSDCTTDAFLAAFKRFTSRRGLCRTISSDCGTNFVGADAELRSLFAAASSESTRIAAALANDGVEWRFNPPSAPHFGGLWEAAVKSVKHHLRRVIGETKLTFEEMTTLLAQIESCLNSRPLQALTDDPEDLNALTPGHYLIGAPLSAVPEPSLIQLPASRLSRWQLLQQMRDSFWRRWASEYLHQLQARPKWHRPQPPLQIGDLVIVVNELYPPTKWPLARVTATHAGGDGQVRVATVKTATSLLKRPIVKLCRLAKRDDLERHATEPC